MNTISVTASISRKAGGLQQSVRRLHQSLNEIPGVKVSVAALSDEYSVQDAPEWAPLPISLSPVFGPRAFGFSSSLFPNLLQSDPDIMHSHGIWQYPSLAVNRWHKRTGRPYLISPHGMLDPWAVRNSVWKKRIALAFYERRHLENASCIRALCESEAQAIRQFGLRNSICIIPNGIDLPYCVKSSELRAESSAFARFTQGRKMLLYLGRIHPKKGLVNLLKAWAKNRKSEEWVLAIAGWEEKGHEAELKQLAMELGIHWTDVRSKSEIASPSSKPPSVVFLGPQFGDAKAACYVNCDAFILPSFSEGLPMVILEAWAYGKPVLMTPQCNLPEGFTVNAAIQIDSSVESIAAGLDFLFHASGDQIHTLGKNGHSLVAARFNWARCAREMVEVYHWLLGSGTKPAVVV